jgi:hypothetical protein
MNKFLKISCVVLLSVFMISGSSVNSFAEQARTLSGKVLETMDSGGYTYVHIENEGNKTWVAVPKTRVEKGQNISFTPGSEMHNFQSKTLNRTFDKIIFAGAVLGESREEIKPHGSKESAVKVTEKIKVEKAAGPDAYTVSEVFRNSKSLEEKKVVIRGKVVKVSTGIMKKNWIHLQDGTGDAGNNDLVITTDELPKMGEIVTASGILYNDKDFGGGYKYKVIIENASFKP